MNTVLKTGLVSTLRRLQSLVFGLLMLVIIVGGTVNALTNSWLDSINGQYIALNRDIDTMLNGMVNQETGIRGYLFTGNPAFLQPFYQGQDEYRQAKADLQKLLQQDGFPEGQRQFAIVDESAQTWQDAYALVQMRLAQSSGPAQPDLSRDALHGKQLFDAFRKQIGSLQVLLDRYVTNQRTLRHQLNWGSLAIAFLLSLLLVAIFWRNFGRVTSKLEAQFLALRTTAFKLTQGDLQARAPISGFEELVQVAQGINHMVDTLEQKQVVLVKNEQQFRLLAETIPHMVLMVSAQGTLQYCNQHWYAYSGLTLQQSQEWLELAHPEDLKRCREQWRDTINHGIPLEVEARLKRAADGMYRWNLLQALPVMDQNEQISHWFVTMTDIEDRKQMKWLAEINQRQRVFVSTVSHEFRTSLTSIQGFSQLLHEEELSAEEIKDFAHDISEESLRLHRMIDDVLDLEKMRDGKMPLHRVSLDLSTLLHEGIEHMQAASQQHVIRCQVDEHLPPLEADRDKLLRVVSNLLSNAIKYSPEGGEILVTGTREGDMLHVSVRDHGIGISPEAMQQIFIPFHRGDVENITTVRGTGLGLPIVEQIITQHGGRIWVESIQGLGSIFHFTLLLTPATATEHVPESALAEAAARKLSLPPYDSRNTTV
jgi:PAS domain S-box-containing protein